MNKEEFKRELEKYHLNLNRFLDLRVAWDHLSYSEKVELLKEEQGVINK